MATIEVAIVEFLHKILNTIGWPGVVLVMALESANIPIPSEVTMPLSGWMLVQAKELPLWRAALDGGFYGALGCTLGSIASYLLGLWGGRPFLQRWGRYILISQHDLEQADRWFARWGDWAVFISRLLPIVRTFISFPAGVVRVRFARFMILSFIGSFIWCGVLAVAGHIFGSEWERIREIMRPFDIPIAVAILAGTAYYIYRHIRRAQGVTPQEAE
ncbi:MAG: DedA family protein [Anaerolineae bacterium]|nr:DedA family protein [Anaerolineae bacterium]MCX8066996.1 DedA family protein [Anaerolineae bacterium]MDW7991276.1 DedA family protein [Anaerolineae bacterium]